VFHSAQEHAHLYPLVVALEGFSDIWIQQNDFAAEKCREPWKKNYALGQGNFLPMSKYLTLKIFGDIVKAKITSGFNIYFN
jgi:hypothetical protein